MTIWKPPTSQSHSTSTAQIKHYKHPPFPPSHALKLHCHGPVVAAWVGGLSWPRCVGLRSAYAHLKPVGEAVRAVSRASRLRSRPVSRHRLGPPFPVEVPATSSTHVACLRRITCLVPFPAAPHRLQHRIQIHQNSESTPSDGNAI